MAKEPVTVVIRYQAQPGKGPQVRRELAALISTVLALEPACLGIRLLQDTTDETRFLLDERWTDQEAYTGPHMRTPHLQEFIQKAPAILAGPPDITFWRQVSEKGDSRR